MNVEQIMREMEEVAQRHGVKLLTACLGEEIDGKTFARVNMLKPRSEEEANQIAHGVAAVFADAVTNLASTPYGCHIGCLYQRISEAAANIIAADLMGTGDESMDVTKATRH